MLHDAVADNQARRSRKCSGHRSAGRLRPEVVAPPHQTQVLETRGANAALKFSTTIRAALGAAPSRPNRPCMLAILFDQAQTLCHIVAASVVSISREMQAAVAAGLV